MSDLVETVTPLKELERREIEKALRVTKGSVGKAAKLLGIGRATLYRRVEQFSIRLEEFKKAGPDVSAIPIGKPEERRLDVTFKMEVPACRVTPLDRETTGGKLGA